MAKVYFFNGGAYGHIYPTLGLVSELVRRGEEVTYYSTEPFRGLIEPTGATFRAYDVLQPDESISSVEHLGAYMLRWGAALLPGLVETARVEKPDYVLFDMQRPWGWQLAKIFDIPAISSSPSFAFSLPILLALSPRLLLELFRPRKTQTLSTHVEQYQETVATLKAAYGVDSPPIWRIAAMFGDLTLVNTTRRFQPAAWTLNQSVQFIGPSIQPRSQESDFPFERLYGRRVVYISLGTVFNERPDFYQKSFAAFAGRDVVVVLSVGDKLDVKTLGDIPPNFIVRNHVPQLEVLQYTDVFLTHGGMGSVHEALYYHVPMVVYPQMYEQATVARQVARHGAGIPLVPVALNRQGKEEVSFSADELRLAVEKVLDTPAYKRNAERMGKEFQRYTPARAADIVQRFVHRWQEKQQASLP